MAKINIKKSPDLSSGELRRPSERQIQGGTRTGAVLRGGIVACERRGLRGVTFGGRGGRNPRFPRARLLWFGPGGEGSGETETDQGESETGWSVAREREGGVYTRGSTRSCEVEPTCRCGHFFSKRFQSWCVKSNSLELQL